MIHFGHGTSATPTHRLIMGDDGFTFVGKRKSNYDSAWFQVSANSTYTKTHNLGWVMPFPPTIRILFSTVQNPVLGTHNIYEIGVNSMSGNVGNPTNTVYGITHIRHVNSNTILISTAKDGGFYSSGGEDVTAQTTGYYLIYMYR